MYVKSNEFCVVFLEVGFIYTSIDLNSPKLCIMRIMRSPFFIGASTYFFRRFLIQFTNDCSKILFFNIINYY